MNNRVTLRDIAKKLNVTPGTVSKALNGAYDVSEEMKNLIQDTAVEMGYVNRKSLKEDNRKICIFIKV
jgi:LacI family transcriptional regulator